MKIKLFLAMGLSFIYLFSIAQENEITIEGYLKSKNSPLANWSVINMSNQNNNTRTDVNGKFMIKVKENDVLNFFSPDMKYTLLTVFQITKKELAEKVLTIDEEEIEYKNAGVAITSKSYWLGATIGYNLSGTTTEDVIGSAKVVINPLDGQIWSADWGIIGNFSNFSASQDKTDLDKSISKITQSSQGLFLGMGLVKKLDKSEKNSFRLELTTGARLNTFTKVGSDSSTVSLLQSRTSVGLEFEGLSFKNGGLLNLSIEGSISLFDKDLYNKVFNEYKSSLFALEGTIILPIASNTGILFNSTISPGHKPTFLLGIIFKKVTSNTGGN